MALQSGIIITENDMRNLLEKNDREQSGVRTWRKLFGNAALGYNAQSSALLTDYSDVIAEAYKSNLAQNNTIMGAGLSAGATREAMSASRRDLHTAYQSYVQNYNKNASALAENYAKDVGVIDQALTERAQNFSKLYNSAYRYLQEELYGSYNKETNADILKGSGLEWLGDGEGNLKPWSQISTQMFDDDLSLNNTGRQFFDYVFNSQFGDAYSVSDDKLADDETMRTMRDFNTWLSDVSADEKDELAGMYEWYISQDPFNYNFASTNRGSMNVYAGGEDEDKPYGKYNYLTAQDVTDVDAILSDFLVLKQPSSFVPHYEIYNPMTANDPGSAAGVALGKLIADDIKNKESEKQSRQDWENYRKNVQKYWSELDDTFKTKVGSAAYDTFMSQNKSIIDEYKSIIDELNKTGDTDTNLVERAQDVFARMHNRMIAHMNHLISVQKN